MEHLRQRLGNPELLEVGQRTVNYRELLKKYMRHVGNEEGVYFIPGADNRHFTSEEIKELDKIADSLSAEL